jgi:hypothetical protein
VDIVSSVAEYLGVGNGIDALYRARWPKLSMTAKSFEKVAKVSAKVRG